MTPRTPGDDRQQGKRDDGRERDRDIAEPRSLTCRRCTAGDDREPDPHDRVIDHRDAEGQLAEVAVQDTEISEDLDDHRHRTHREGEAGEGRERPGARLGSTEPRVDGEGEDKGRHQRQARARPG